MHLIASSCLAPELGDSCNGQNTSRFFWWWSNNLKQQARNLQGTSRDNVIWFSSIGRLRLNFIRHNPMISYYVCCFFSAGYISYPFSFQHSTHNTNANTIKYKTYQNHQSISSTNIPGTPCHESLPWADAKYAQSHMQGVIRNKLLSDWQTPLTLSFLCV